jgi:hypothetical protein
MNDQVECATGESLTHNENGLRRLGDSTAGLFTPAVAKCARYFRLSDYWQAV